MLLASTLFGQVTQYSHIDPAGMLTFITQLTMCYENRIIVLWSQFRWVWEIMNTSHVDWWMSTLYQLGLIELVH